MSKQSYHFDWMTDETAKLWDGLVLGELKNANLIHSSEDNAYTDMQIAALEIFKREKPEFHQSGDVASMVMVFRNWVQNWEGITGAGEIEEMNISMQKRVQNSDGDYWLMLTAKVRPDGNITAARRFLQGVLNDQAIQMAGGYKQETRSMNEQQQRNESATPHTEVWESTLISCNFQDNKKFVRVHGGRWQKFGVAIYDEVLDTIGFKREAMNPGQYNGKWKAVCELNSDGKPVRIKSIERVA